MSPAAARAAQCRIGFERCSRRLQYALREVIVLSGALDQLVPRYASRRSKSELCDPWRALPVRQRSYDAMARTSLEADCTHGLHSAHAPTGFTWPLNTYAQSPVRAMIYKTALAGARPTRHQSRISSSSSNDGKNLGVTCLYAR